MTRRQRAWHQKIWTMLLVLLLGLFAAALIARERVGEAAEAVRRLNGGE